MSRFTSILIGHESLVIQCGEALRARGHGVTAVVTRNADVRRWAMDAGLRCEEPDDGLAETLSQGADWLFSVANLDMLDDEILALGRKGAINFHDGPLPRYAGLNAPVWARINGETRHGITWHLMQKAADKGDILVQKMFDIAPGDTALTLNTKCYEAAIETFGTLVDQIATDALSPVQQDFTHRSYYSRDARPVAAGRLSFVRPGEELVSLVRALDHGGYFNPLTCPKISVGGQVVLVKQASLASGDAAQQTPGMVLAVSAGQVTVATSTGALVLEGLSDTNGVAVEIADLVSVGEVLPSPGPEEARALDAVAKAVAPNEGDWRERLASLKPAVLPLAGKTGFASPSKSIDLNIPAEMCGNALLTLAAVVFASGNEQSHCDFAFASGPKLPDVAAGYVSGWVPVRMPCQGALGEARQSLAQELQGAGDSAGFALDLVARAPDIADLLIPQVGLTTDSQPIPGTAVTVSADGKLHYDPVALDEAAADLLAQRIAFAGAAADDAKPLTDLPVLSADERLLVTETWNSTAKDFDPVQIHRQFEAQVDRTPDATALVFEHKNLTYAQLNERANRVAHVLADMGVTAETVVGIYCDRSIDMMVAALGILKAGGAYLPLDPAYPADRIALYVEDSACPVIVTQSHLSAALPDHRAQVVCVDSDPRIPVAPIANPISDTAPEDLAYLIYTSGSTGKPKGVMVEHRNVANFFFGMDERVDHEGQGVWLAVTSLSFDISVLELFWTLSRGFKLVLSSDESRSLVSDGRIAMTGKGMDFGLFYWGNDDGAGPKKYELLLEGAKFADAHGFNSVWTPERHFHAFGGPFPNPAVTGAAVAAVTKNLEVRAGSCVAPLHHTARIAEEWAVIDNLTNGKVGIGIASGWQPNDFVLRPENAPPDNKPAMMQAIEDLRALWRGEPVEFPDAKGQPFAVVTQPRPVSKELPVWLTTAGNPETWKEAGSVGANVLTHLLGQTIDEVGDKIKLYHQALRDAGYDPATHTVTLMLHTYVGHDRDQVRETARGPMKDYLRSAAGLIKQFAWAFPAFKKPKGVNNPFELDLGMLSDEELDAILEFAFIRYFEDSGLFGTVEDCLDRVEQLKRIGVDEIGCLIDYGIPTPRVLEGLWPLAEVLRRTNETAGLADDDFSIAAQIVRHGVTHLQCTPSLARMLSMNEEARFALKGLQQLLVGGEALAGALVQELRGLTVARIENMYGPTETTIWSTTETAVPGDGVANIGSPIANTQVYVLDENRDVCPIGVPGELYIGGAGVTRGYWQREDLTADRFVANPFGEGRLYRAGDLVRWRADGKLDFLGRADHQIKLRGHRIELGEIESRMDQLPGIKQAVVVSREDTPGDVRLVAYMVTNAAVNDGDLRRELAQALPEFMIPSHFVAMDNLPLTPNKKVDRKALPAPKERVPEAQPATIHEPSGDTETKIAQIWSATLGVSRVNGRDNFFDLGGHSLLAVQVHREIRKSMGATLLAITDIFRFPVLADLAARVNELTGTGGSQTAANTDGATKPEETGRGDAMARRREMRARRRALRA